MKNWFYAALSALLVTGCASHEGYTLSGEVPEAWEGKPVVLYTIDAGTAEAVDSATIADGAFRLRGEFDMPRRCRAVVYLDPENRQDRNLMVSFPVFLDSTEVHAVCDGSKAEPVFTLTGGATQGEWQAYEEALAPLAAQRRKANEQYVEAFYRDEDIARGVEAARRVDEEAARILDFKIAYIRQHPRSAVSLAVLQELGDRHSPLGKERMEELFGALDPALRESAAGRYTGEVLARRQIVVGNKYPDLELRDREGRPRRISDLVRPGHYTLIELWASWCNPCRADIPFVKKSYEKYRRKGFDVVYVSIDRKTEEWQQALDEERMPWPQLVDTARLSFEAYETTAVPTSILVDGEGRIYRLNARGGWLDAALEDIYGE